MTNSTKAVKLVMVSDARVTVQCGANDRIHSRKLKSLWGAFANISRM